MKLKYELDTPCLVLDLDLLEYNISNMQKFVNQAGKNLRPHAKTHKCFALAQKQIEAGAIGICAAKVSEAEILVHAGINNILITGPVATPKKIKRLIELVEKAPSLMVVVDHTRNVELLAAGLKEKGLSINVLLDLDAGLHRTGVSPENALDLAEIIISHPELCLRGIQAYAGQVQHISSYDTRKEESQKSLMGPAVIFRELHGMVDTCRIFSGAGTGTFNIDVLIPELTELQVGSYVFMDTEYLAIAQSEKFNGFSSFVPSLSVLTTVVSQNQAEFVTVDSGLKSLYRDGGNPKIIGTGSDGLTYEWFGDEYGRIRSEKGQDLPILGSVLELITSHCDPTINLFEKLHLTRGDEVVDIWNIDLRGCSQ